MKSKYDLIVVGAGVLGTFHAYHAQKAGLKVALLEKNTAPVDATVRNFGQVVPSGMDSKWQAYGRESLLIYKDLQERHDISVRNHGTVYLASDYEELTLLEELARINLENGYSSHMMTKTECLEKYPGLRTDYCKGGLFFPEEVTVEPRRMIQEVHKIMAQMGVDIFFNTQVVETEALSGCVKVSSLNGKAFRTQKVLICNGHDFKSLFPQRFAESDLEVTKLQMMQTEPQGNYHLPGSVLTGLTIRRYEAFCECPSYDTIKAKEDPNSPQKKWGVHILFKQAADGSVILGDSHQYADAAQADSLGFDLDMDIDEFMTTEAKKIIDLPNYRIKQRWFGLYSQCKNADLYQETIANNIHIVTGIGGKGMTGSAGFARMNINQLFNI